MLYYLQIIIRNLDLFVFNRIYEAYQREYIIKCLILLQSYTKFFGFTGI